MARHVPLYRALLELLRALSSCSSLVPLLLPLSTSTTEEEEEEEPNAQSHTSVSTLLAKMKTCVDTYTNRLRSVYTVLRDDLSVCQSVSISESVFLSWLSVFCLSV